MTNVLLYTIGCALFTYCRTADPIDVEVVVDTSHVIQDIDENLFVGVTMDCYIMQDNWEGFDFRSACKFPKPKHCRDWDNWNTFVEKVGWKMIFGINGKKRIGAKWDPTNALSLLKYTVQKGYPIYWFELSNEITVYPHRVAPDQLGADFDVLHHTLQSFPHFAQTLLIGPYTGYAASYFYQFLKSIGGRRVYAATYHHSYVDGATAVLSQFIDPKILDTLIPNIKNSPGLAKSSIPGKLVWLGETSSAENSGAPGISDTFVAGFMWMVTWTVFKNGCKRRYSQDYYGGNYSLIQQNTFYPIPDYWLTFLYKRLVGRHVFNVKVKADNSFRVYAHCAKQNNEYKYGAGSLVLYAMNLKTSQVKFELPDFIGQRCDMFWLSSVNNNLTSTILVTRLQIKK